MLTEQKTHCQKDSSTCLQWGIPSCKRDMVSVSNYSLKIQGTGKRLFVIRGKGRTIMMMISGVDITENTFDIL